MVEMDSEAKDNPHCGICKTRTPRNTIVALAMLLGFWRSAFSLNPLLDLDQYAHTAWKNQEGFVRGALSSIAQTPDGYLWLGTDLGLLRFDGVRTVAWQPPQGEPLPDSSIRVLLGARDGALWIGTLKGLASLKDGRLITYPQLAGDFINALLQDREGVVWVASVSQASDRAKICTMLDGGAHCDEDRYGQWVGSLHEDSKGQVWAAAATGLWRLRPEAPKLQALPAPLAPSFQALADDGDGALLIATRGGLVRLAGEIAMLVNAVRTLPSSAHILRDRDGGLWIGTVDAGLLHVHNGHTDAFRTFDGLAGDSTNALFEDREGDIWVATAAGLDRFRDVAAATYSTRQELSSSTVASVLASRDGSMWISTWRGLDRWRNGEKWVYAPRDGNSPQRAPPAGVQAAAAREIAGSGLPDGRGSLFEDSHGRVWVGSTAGLGYLKNDRYVAIEGVSGGYVDAITEDSSGNMWVAHHSLGLLRVSPDRKVQRIPWPQLGSQNAATRLAADSEHGGLWLGFVLGGVAHFVDGRLRESYSAGDGLAKGQVFGLRLDPDGALWVGAEGGLSRLKNGRIATLDSTNGLPCNSVDWMIDDDTGAVWVRTACGLLRIPRSELEAWAAAVDRGGDATGKIRATLFDDSSGVRSTTPISSYGPAVAKSLDGRLWFATLGGVGVVDPRRQAQNALPPPVHIEQIVADRNTYKPSSQARLPPVVRNLQIDYTALSLVAPEKNQFRYKLEGHDRDWQDVGNRRQAFYSDLAPGNYRFRVIATNNSGVWNEQGAALDFSIAPAYWQTIWFRAACVGAFFAVLWALYQLRLHQIAQEFNVRLAERVAERGRIARELHDTLLQNFQGLLLRFQTVLALCETRPADAKQVLRSSIDQTAQAITEGREAIQGLRAMAEEITDFPAELRALGGLAATETGSESAALDVQVQGEPRSLRPIVRDEMYRIAGEALRNAFRHAHATRVELELRYDTRQLRLVVRDDGKGVEAEVLGEEEHPGHFGLRGMRERAKLIGGELDVWSGRNLGTQIELSVPGSRAYFNLDSSAVARIAGWLSRTRRRRAS
jgi:signal transduction histidine kinase/ligand-binding sensor domain-containing protein